MNPERAKKAWETKQPQTVLKLWLNIENEVRSSWEPGKTVFYGWRDKTHRTIMRDLVDCAHGWGWRVRWYYFYKSYRGDCTGIELRAPADCRWWEFWWWGK